jgi:carotenoid cleavage dioxygenase-like enzyme
MVHGVRLGDGRAEWYRNRWVRSKALAAQRDEQWPAGPVHENTDFAANTCIIARGGRTLATVEAGPLPYELTDELDTVGPCDFGGSLPGGFAAHTKLDHATLSGRGASCRGSPAGSGSAGERGRPGRR